MLTLGRSKDEILTFSMHCAKIFLLKVMDVSTVYESNCLFASWRSRGTAT